MVRYYSRTTDKNLVKGCSISRPMVHEENRERLKEYIIRLEKFRNNARQLQYMLPKDRIILEGQRSRAFQRSGLKDSTIPIREWNSRSSDRLIQSIDIELENAYKELYDLGKHKPKNGWWFDENSKIKTKNKITLKINDTLYLNSIYFYR